MLKGEIFTDVETLVNVKDKEVSFWTTALKKDSKKAEADLKAAVLKHAETKNATDRSFAITRLWCHATLAQRNVEKAQKSEYIHGGYRIRDFTIWAPWFRESDYVLMHYSRVVPNTANHIVQTRLDVLPRSAVPDSAFDRDRNERGSCGMDDPDMTNKFLFSVTVT